ncbi:carboxyl transferase domain-containing protein [Paracidovorax citrulli]|uniref:carboxyl transferase domain-containing protein n=1 Tax=Paracidovorax citrulli TaxID=80869 RepID=UPI00094272C7|nr:carboxyl transferase domain-containing protein [Paracidovorax citrulli]UMT88924.1 propionyl-CoA carboxylase [Paracidovorax citrulli]WIY36337.1 carboxyl transferase domain-containing protein [Paracidovorax citrulli]
MSISAARTRSIFDTGTFTETRPSIESHFICGKGLVDSRTVFLIMNRGRDCEFDDRLQRNTAPHIIRTVEQAAQAGAPLLYVQDQLGDPDRGFDTTRVITADLSTLLLSPSGMGRVSACLARFAEQHLMVSAVLGPTSGPLALPLMLADLVLMTRKGALCMGRPDMVRAMLGQECDLQSLGGAQVHSDAGSAQLVFDDEQALFACARKLIRLDSRQAPRRPARGPRPRPMDIGSLIPHDPGRPYDAHALVEAVADAGSLVEISPRHAPEVLTGFATVGKHPMALIANNPRHQSGAIQGPSARKMVRAIRIADKLRIPIVFFADVPGFMIGREAERSGIFSAAAELFSAHVRSTVPKILIVVRKAFTGGLYAMHGPGFDPVAILAFPHAHIGVFGIKTMEAILESAPPEKRRVVELLRREISAPARLAEKGLVTEVIDPADTRERILHYLAPYLTTEAAPGQPGARARNPTPMRKRA